MILHEQAPLQTTTGYIAIVTAGTGICLWLRGRGTALCGPAGHHLRCGGGRAASLFEHIPTLQQAAVVIVIAGMEGALASVVGGLVDCPVIAVPTSVGYGASFDGLAALLAMLNSCASGVTVVNIDNGFGAAYSASLINMKIEKAKNRS
jgi:NCAIR mutase (PurE)-related protein